MNNKKVLVVVDMQNDFIDGALGTDEAQKIVSNVENKIKSYLDSSDMVLFTQDTHGENYMDTQEGRNLPVKHCIEDTVGWCICDTINKYAQGSKVFKKCSFGSKELAQYLSDIGNISEVEIVGLCTDICVISNALVIKAFMPEVKITVDSSCCAGVSPQSHKNAVEAMKMCQINVI